MATVSGELNAHINLTKCREITSLRWRATVDYIQNRVRLLFVPVISLKDLLRVIKPVGTSM